MAVDPEDDAVVALRKHAGDTECVSIRCCATRNTDVKDEMPTEEKGDLTQVEINYV